MPLLYPTFYRKFGVRALQQLMSPHFFDLAFLELPQDSIYHYIDYDGVTLGPGPGEFVLRHQKHSIPVEPVVLLLEQQGHPRHAGANLPSLLKEYFHKSRRFKWMRDIVQGQRDKQAVVVYDYAPLARAYHYQQSAFVNYWKWRNLFATVLKTIANVTQHSQRQHYIFVGAPKVIPSFHQLELAAREIDQTSLKPFRDNNAYVLLELWRWLTLDAMDHSSKTPVPLSLFSEIPKNKIHLLNFVFLESGKWTVLNLGFLNSFREHKPEDMGGETGYVMVSQKRISGVQVAKRLLKLYMVTMELRTVTAKSDTSIFDDSQTVDNTVVQAPSEAPSSLDLDDDDDDVSVQAPASTVDTAEVARQVTSELTEFDHHQPVDEMTDDEFMTFVAEQDKIIDQDLKQLDEIVKKTQEAALRKKAQIEEIVLAAPVAPPEQAVQQLATQLAGEGAISAGEHRRFERLAESYKTMLAPDGVSTMEQYVEIKPELLTIEPTTMADSPAIIDKSMCHSTLNDFDARYTKHVLNRDIASMVLSIQRAGIAVTNYKVERRGNILGEYEDHTLKITPIVGVSSTLRFKTPVVKPDGTFRSNRHDYRVRKQRADLPIRKTDPDEVALSTYYGRTVVSRGRTLASNYGHWLGSQLTSKILDVATNTFEEPVLANVFQPLLRSPRNYSAISMVFKSGLYKGFYLNFDHADVVKTYMPDMVKKYEVQNQVLFGSNSLDQFLYVDRFGQAFLANETTQETTPLGLLEDFFEIDTRNAPVEYTSVDILSKSIPVGLVLGMEMGLHNLLELLRVDIRIVPAGERPKIEAGEFSVAFSDETWIIPRNNKLACLVLGGFNEFARSLKSFSVYSFDQRGVYVNLLEANGLGARYIREIDLMYQMFVDPISLEILKEMKEPTNFKGLLFRASQMLITDQHPHELDMAFSRIKGYERIAGAVYNQLVQSLRRHNGKLGKSNSPVEMHPYAVWQHITNDSAKDQIKLINPIKAMREQEAVVFSGEGGRSKRAMTRETRAYHPNDMGVISESTVDNSDVALNTYLSSNPQFTSLRGLTRRYDAKRDGIAAILSPAALMAPGSAHDDYKQGILCLVVPCTSGINVAWNSP